MISSNAGNLINQDGADLRHRLRNQVCPENPTVQWDFLTLRGEGEGRCARWFGAPGLLSAWRVRRAALRADIMGRAGRNLERFDCPNDGGSQIFAPSKLENGF